MGYVSPHAPFFRVQGKDVDECTEVSRACVLIYVWCKNKTPDSCELLAGVVCVRLIGLEPTRRETPDPKSGASTNSATSAKCEFCGPHMTHL